MARVVYSALIESIRGSIGGTTFQRNKYGYTCKRKPNMVNPWTELQKQRQISFVRAVRAWREADQATRDNWDTWASVNPQYAKHNPNAQLSGFACFVRWHSFAFLCGLPVDTMPALTIPEQDTVTLTLTLNAGVLTLHQQWTLSEEAWNVAIFVSRPFGPAQNFIGTRTRYCAYTTSSTQNTNITSQYIALFGSLPSIGDRVAVDIVMFMESGGAVLARQQYLCEVVAP